LENPNRFVGFTYINAMHNNQRIAYSMSWSCSFLHSE
jgi:hypothetical protein